MSNLGAHRHADVDMEEYALRSRLPRRMTKRENDIFVNTKTDFKGQLERAKRLINSGKKEVFIHGVGNAVNRAINIALQIQLQHGGMLKLDVRTSSLEIVDDFEPLDDDLEVVTETRQVSVIHIRLFTPSR